MFEFALGEFILIFGVILKLIINDGVLPGKTFVIVERPGKQEGNELELEFRCICNGINYQGAPFVCELERALPA